MSHRFTSIKTVHQPNDRRAHRYRWRCHTCRTDSPRSYGLYCLEYDKDLIRHIQAAEGATDA